MPIYNTIVCCISMSKLESTNQAADSHPSSDVHNLMFVWSLALLPREGGAAPPPGAAVLTIWHAFVLSPSPPIQRGHCEVLLRSIITSKQFCIIYVYIYCIHLFQPISSGILPIVQKHALKPSSSIMYTKWFCVIQNVICNNTSLLPPK